MSITRKRTVDQKAIEAFIDAAPDAPAPTKSAKPRKPIKTAGHKSIITVSMSPDVLARLDTWAAGRGMSRAAAISFAVSSLQ